MNNIPIEKLIDIRNKLYGKITPYERDNSTPEKERKVGALNLINHLIDNKDITEERLNNL